MNAREILEGALYLSLKDQRFDDLPSKQPDRDNIVKQYLPELSHVLVAIGKKNPGLSHVSVKTEDLLEDPDLKIKYVDLQKNPFLTIFRAEFLYSGGSLSVSLTRLGLSDFFGNSENRTTGTFPAFYNYNVFTGRLYVYPNPSSGGVINIFGKRRLGPLNTLDDVLPDEVSDTFEIYLQYYLAKFLCAKNNAPWQAQKEELLMHYKRLLDSENNTAYQSISLQEGIVPRRNIRITL